MPEIKDVQKKRVGIMRGGKGENYNSSLRKGGDIILHIVDNLADKYKTFDILIDKEGVWHLNGVPIRPADLIHKVDVVWNIADPNAVTVLDSFSIPNVSNNSFSSILENSRDMLREHMKMLGVGMPRSILLPVYQKDFDGPRERYAIKKAKEVHEKFGAPWVVKSIVQDSHMGIHVTKTFNELVEAVEDGVSHGESILVEELIMGKTASVHSLEDFRGEDIYNFPLRNFSSAFTHTEKEELGNFVKDLRRHLGVKYYLKSDLVLNPKGKIYVLNIESIPDLRQNSHFQQVCDSAGIKAHHIVEHILDSA